MHLSRVKWPKNVGPHWIIVLCGSLMLTALGAAAQQTEQAKLIGSDTAIGDQFGYSVSIDGDTAVVGAFGADHFPPGDPAAGAVYVFVRSGGCGTWSQQAKLTASDVTALDQFGNSVSIDGDTVVVGAWQDDHAGGFNAGSAYIFVRSGPPGSETWTLQAKLTASDTAFIDFFGFSVSVAGDTAIVGSYRDNHAGGKDETNEGSAYVFVRSGPPGSEIWTQQVKLTASDAASSDEFGYSVSIDGDTAVVGSHLDDHAGGLNAGSAYVFVRSGPPGSETWTQQAKLTASDAAAFREFGNSVSIDGDTAIVGSYRDNAGSAYVFVRSGSPGSETWTQQPKLTPSDAAPVDHFGYSVSIAGDTAVVGSYLEDHAGVDSAGSAYVFVRAAGGTTWTEQAKLTASDAGVNDHLGGSVSINGETVLVGSDQDDHAGGINAGSAYVFALTGDIPCPADTDGNGFVNVDDLLAVINGWGTCPRPCPPSGTPTCPADMAPTYGGNCLVNVDDLLTVINAWGSCS